MVDAALTTLSFHVWLFLSLLDRHVQVVCDIVHLLHGLISDSSLGLSHREGLPKHLCILARYEPLITSTDLLG